MASRGRTGMFLWLLAASLVIAAFAVGLARLPNPPQTWPTPDLSVYKDAALLVLDGQNPYGRPLGFFSLPYTYPPFSLLVFLPFANLWPSLFVLAIVNTTALAITVLLVLRNCAPASTWLGTSAQHAVLGGAVLLGAQWLKPVAGNIAFGQVNVVLMTIVLIDVLAVPPKARGVLTGIAAMIKLIPLIFVVFILWSRQRRMLITFLVTCLVCAALPFVVIPGIARDYMAQWLLHPDQPGRTYPVPLTNQSLHAVAMRALGPAPLPVEVLWIVLSSAVIAMLLLALAGLRRDDAALAVCYVALAGLLISPVSWSHHWVWLVPLTTAVLCQLRRFPLLVAGVGLTLLLMAGEPWFLQRGADLRTDSPLLDVIWAHGFILGALVVLLIAAGYGVRELRRKPASPAQEAVDALTADRS